MVLKKSEESCAYCGCTNVFALTKDHLIPKCRGGTDDKKNIQTLCWWCNQLKGPLLENEYKEYYKLLVDLHKLKKVRILQPERLVIQFNHSFHPGWEKNKVADEP